MLLMCQGCNGLFGFNWFQQRGIKVYNKNESDEPQHMHIAVVNLNCASAESVLVCYTAVFSGVTQRSSPQFPGMWCVLGSRLWEGALRDDTENGCAAE